MTNGLASLREYLYGIIIGQPHLVDGALLGLITGRPTVFVGPPGTAKTTVVEIVARAMGLRYAYRLLTRYTMPEELFGPIDVVALRNEGVYRRKIDGSIIDADIVMLDEVFKASSAILNTLLDILLFGRFYDGQKYVQVSWIAIYAASNEVPDDPELQALYDRWLIRVFIRDIPESLLYDAIQASFRVDAVLRGLERPPAPSVKEVLDVRSRAEDVARRAINSNIGKQFVEVVTKLKMEGFEMSTRRVAQAWRLAAAIAVGLYGQDFVTIDDIVDALMFTAPRNPEDVPRLEQVLNKYRIASSEDMQLIVAIESAVTRLEREMDRMSVKDIVQIIKETDKRIMELKEKIEKGENLGRRALNRALEAVSRYHSLKKKASEMLQNMK